MSEPAEAIASGWLGDHGPFDVETASCCSLDVDLRRCWPNVTDRGLNGKDDGFWLEEDDGDPDNLRLSALEKLHFFEGVLRTVGTGSFVEFEE